MRSILNWIGGKSLLAPTIIKMMPEHTCYCEPFAGAAQVFFRKEPSKVEVLNDLNGELVTLYRVLQYHLEEFCRQFKWLLTSREWWDDWSRQLKAGGLTDIQRAARFYYLQRLSFGGKVCGRTYGYSAVQPRAFNLLRLEEDLSSAHIRLNRVQIENQPFQEVMARYDRPETLFFVDPPYYGVENYYGKDFFCRDDFAKLADVLGNVKGKFILSINDTPQIREIFKAFIVEEAAVRYSCAKTERPEKPELLYRNFLEVC